jgi:hypothetical protein
MTSLELFIEGHPVLFATLAALLPFLFPRFRAWFGKGFQWAFSGRQLLREVAVDVKLIKQEVQFSNDTSTKQEVALLKKRSYLEFWRQNKPAIEMDGDAQVQHVSENLCFLMGVRNPADLHLRNWLRCVEAGRVDEFLSAFAQTVKFKSDFDFAFHIQTKDGHAQGEWKLMMADVTPPGYSKTLYSGFFKPMDDRAKEIAAEMHWSR